MISKKDDFDQLLHNYFQEEARRLELPDTGRCWEDFQQLLEKRGENGLHADEAVPVVGAPQKGIVYLLGRKYKNLSALAAACILGIMLLSGMPPFQSLREAIGGMLPGTGKIAGTKMEWEGAEADAKLAEGMPGAAKAPASLQITQAPEPAAPQRVEEGADTLPDEVGEMGILQRQRAMIQETNISNYDSLNAYRAGLQESKGLIRGKIFYLAVPPEGYTFKEGTIHKTDASLLGVRQEFSNDSGDLLTVQQDFFEAEITEEKEEAQVPAGEQPKAALEQSKLEYELFPLNGQKMLRAVVADSVLTITAGLDEEGLLLVFGKLEELDNN